MQNQQQQHQQHQHPQMMHNGPPGGYYDGQRPPHLGLMMSPQVAAHQMPPMRMNAAIGPVAPNIRYVWADNLEQEFALLRDLVDTYNYVLVSTEFAGVMGRCMGAFRSTSDFHYQTVRVNADLMNLIQMGITLTDANGNRPNNNILWQFNFRYNLEEEMFASDAMDNLLKTGLNPLKHQADGIDPVGFASLLIDSGLVLMPNVHWITYHAGMDLGFLIALLTNDLLPMEQEAWTEWCHLYFPNVYDLKYLYSLIRPQSAQVTGKSSIEGLADELGIARLNHMYQVGNQCHLTSLCFMELKKQLPSIAKTNGVVWGFGEIQPLQAEAPGVAARGVVHYGRAGI
ncbi:hypothetical protein BABINDRAFT_163963 [Babjeviella inositovora NRRL Y-12698]|uniref:poly(A)-specific ribonuclease n=1 Tax=Babjeviella inositovora NRRL Y-12698 TaxID=984486 RepID=A0A1E3QIS1_9ASCO|nr:uncharacterized protein BABINDRAFT_163963 [Babjeviella inositovora NRRL Y-12698]ODQ76962.1 hypothetical protein BABINDRAFT_163963 [Babjeviella inositovora NRRL Y-12698]